MSHSPSQSRGRPPLWLAAMTVAAFWGAVYDVGRWVYLFALNPVHIDFSLFYVAAQARLGRPLRRQHTPVPVGVPSGRGALHIRLPADPGLVNRTADAAAAARRIPGVDARFRRSPGLGLVYLRSVPRSRQGGPASRRPGRVACAGFLLLRATADDRARPRCAGLVAVLARAPARRRRRARCRYGP